MRHRIVRNLFAVALLSCASFLSPGCVACSAERSASPAVPDHDGATGGPAGSQAGAPQPVPPQAPLPASAAGPASPAASAPVPEAAGATGNGAGAREADPARWTAPDASGSVTISVDAAQKTGAVPLVLRPSVMATWADKAAMDLFFSEVKRPGMVRVAVEAILADSQSLEDYLRRLRKFGQEIAPLKRPGAEMVVTVSRMPAWLSANPSRSRISQYGLMMFEASPPRDYAEWNRLVFETVKHLNVDLGLDLYYEFWAEPNSKSMWQGTEAELFKLYKHFVEGARKADPRAKVGGPTVSSWSEAREGASKSSGSLLYGFIKYCGETPLPALGLPRLPLDFVSWHHFSAEPAAHLEDGIPQVRRWLTKHGYPEDTPQVIDEWSYWQTYPDWDDPVRDTAQGAAFVAATHFEMARAGVDMQSIAALQDFYPGKGSPYHGDWGILTRPGADPGGMQSLKRSAMEKFRGVFTPEQMSRFSSLVRNQEVEVGKDRRLFDADELGEKLGLSPDQHRRLVPILEGLEQERERVLMSAQRQLFKKPSYNVYVMLDRLGDSMLAAAVADPDAGGEPSSMGAIATRDDDRVAVLIWNLTSRPEAAALRRLLGMGYSLDYFRERRVSKEQLRGAVQGQGSIDALPLPEETKADLREVQAMLRSRAKVLQESRTVHLQVSGLGYPSARLETYLIDSTHSNGPHHFRRAQEGGMGSEALTEVRAHQDLERVEERALDDPEGGIAFALEPFAVCLVVLSRM